jgi:Tol biopolymer transport system component
MLGFRAGARVLGDGDVESWGLGMKRRLGFHDGFGRRRVGVLGAVALVAGLAAGPGMLAAHSSVPVGAIERVSVAGNGAERNARPDSGSSLACSPLTPRRCTKRTISDDGTKVVYSSAADNLVDGDTNGHVDVFLATLSPGKPPTAPVPGAGGHPGDPGIPPSVVSTVRISVGPGGVEGNGDSLGPSISPDGHWVSFESSATNLVPSDPNGPIVDVFVYHVDDQSLRLASVPAGGGGGDGNSYSASVANNGTVSFTSVAGNMAPGGSGQQVYVREDPAGAAKTEMVSATSAGGAGDGQSGESTISGDGTKIAFTSNSTNLGSGHAKVDDIFVRNLGATYSLYMVTSGATAYLPSITADGSKVIFIANGIDNDGIGDIYQGPSDGSARPTIYAACPCRDGGKVAPGSVALGSGGAIVYSSASPFSKSNRYLAAQVFEHNPGQAIVSSVGGEAAIAPAEFPSVDGDGVLVAFQSAADNLVDDDVNAANDVFVAQMGDGGNGFESWRMVRVSVYANGAAHHGADSFAPMPESPAAVSSDGNLVAFASDSSNLVPGDTNNANDIFLRNRHTGQTERVSVANDGGQADGASLWPAMSGDGRFVVFESDADNLVPGDTNGAVDVFVRDRLNNQTRRLSEKPGAGQSPLPSQHPSISPNGKWVAWDSAGDFSATPQSGSGRPNVFRFNMETGNIDMVSTMAPTPDIPNRRAGFKASWEPSIADDGSVAFLSDQYAMTASNADDPIGAIPNYTDVYIGKPDGTVVKASMNSDPQPVPAIGDSYDPRISADGTHVAFVVGGKKNMPTTGGDANIGSDVFVRDLVANKTVQVSIPPDGSAATGNSRWPTISADGTLVAFTSDAANLVPGDGNNAADVFVAKVAGGVSLSRIMPGSGEPNGPSAMPTLSPDGHTLVFASRASNLVDGDGNGAYDWFARSDADVPCITCTATGIAPGNNDPIGQGGGPVIVHAPGPGYRFVAADGGIFSFDADFFGSTGNLKLAKPIVGMAATPSNTGYWLVASDGGVFSFGDAKFYGSTGNIHLAQPIVGMAATPSGKGYWFVASDGGIFSFGDAKFYGSTGAMKLNKPIVGMAATSTGNGYWLVASDGGIFSFGDAKFYGSTGSIKLAKPIVGMDRSVTGQGYRFVASDGGIFSFGDAKFYGSMGGKPLAKPIVGMAGVRGGDGYWLVASDGGIFSFGAANFHGSTGNLKLASPIVGMAG